MAIGQRSRDQIIDDLNIESSALDFAKDTGLDRIALRGPGPEIAENMFRSRVLAFRPQINAAITAAEHGTVSRLGGNVNSGMTERASEAVHASVFARGAEAYQQGVRVAGQMQDQAAGAYMGVLGQVDQMAHAARLQQEMIESQKRTPLGTAFDVASLVAGFTGPL